jgi:hypothetical protein
MFYRWLKNYRTLMLRTRFLSQFAAFVLLIFAVVELIGVGQATTYAENISWEVVLRATISPLAFLAGFGLRFIFLFLKDQFGPFSVAVSWWAGATAVAICFIDFQGCFLNCPDNMSYYDPFSNPLIPAGFLFVSFSMIRFAVTAIAAISHNEFNSNS